MKNFTGIYIHLNQNIDKCFLKRLTSNNPNCLQHETKGNMVIAYYKHPLHVALILKESKTYQYKLCFAKDSDDKHSRRTLTIRKNTHMSFGILEKNKGIIIYQEENVVVVRFQSFLRTCKVLKQLETIKVKAKFTSFKELKEIQIITPY